MKDAPGSDLALVKRMRSGDERAFTEFFEGHFPRLFRFALTRLGGRADAAEEVAQIALCAAMTRLDTFRGEAALFTWLCSICRHEIGRHYQRLGRPEVKGGLPEDSETARAALDSLAMAEQKLGEHGPEARLQRQETARLVQVALDNLPSSYASALEWKYLQDLPVKEIAGRLNLGLKAAESLLVRARAAFRDGFTALAGDRTGRTGAP